MSCCIEQAVLDALKALTCTPIKAENHFVNKRECKDCLPYLVLKANSTGGLRTSDVVQKIWTVSIDAYFSELKKNAVMDYRDQVETLLYEPGCIPLGACGCFCVTGSPSSSITNVAGGIIKYAVTFRGEYHRAASDSESV